MRLKADSVQTWLVSTIASACACVSTGTRAAEAEPEASGAQLQEVVVTAERREEKSQNVPISLAVLTGQDLESHGVQVLADVGRLTPSVVIDQAASASGGNHSSSIYIRGLGQSDPSSFADPAVGLYLDGVYFGRSVGSMEDIVDLERIEVLKGPQGTLFGRNTMGGAISITSKMPTTEFSGWGEAAYGTLHEHDLRGSLNVPLISGQLATRLTVSSRNRDGYTPSLISGQDQDDVDSLVIRSITRWTPTSDVAFTLIGDWQRVDEAAQGFHLVTTHLNPSQPSGGLLSIFNTLPIAAPATAYGAFDDRWISAGKDFNYSNPLSGLCNCDRIHGGGLSGTLDWSLPGDTHLTSITAYRAQHSEVKSKLDGAPLDFQGNGNLSKQHQFSEELRLAGSAVSGRLKWLLGVYYFDEHIDEQLDVQIAWAGLFKAVGLQNHVWPNTTTRALFTQETFDITANLGITVGVRYNEDRKRVPAQSYNLLTDTFTLPLITKEASWPSWTPKVSLQYQATPAALLYTSYSEGFKGGGFDYQITRNAFLPYGPEKVKSYEAGFKSTWLDRRVQLNGAAYYEDYRDIQLAATVQPGTFNCPVTALPSCSQILNASTAHIKGAELDLIAVPVEHLHVETSAGYISQRLTQINPLLIASGSTIPAAQLPRTPKWTGSVGAQYDLPISFGTVSLRGDYSYRSLQYFDYTNSPILAQAGYGLLNGKLSFLTPDEHWELAVSVQNATDKRYINTGYFSNVFNFASVHYGTPRIVLGSVKFRF